jgi:uncharacterized protein
MTCPAGHRLIMLLSKGADNATSYYFNHSYDPNMWLFTARRDLQEGEELTTDYALCESSPHYRLEPCLCGTALCRGRLTGDDWKLPELQARYEGHFTSYIARLIRHLQA